MSLREYQTAAVDQLTHRTLLVSPTGTGKTRMLSEFAARRAEAGDRVLWVAHRAELLSQASEALRDAMLTPEVNVWVRSVQELRRSGGPPAEVVIFDEAHHLPSDDWSQLVHAQYPSALLVGATATPERGDGRGLGAVFAHLVEAISVKDAIEAGYLVRPVVLRPDRALGPGELAQDPVEAYLTHAAGTKAILFAPTVSIAVQYANELYARDVPSAAIWGDMPAKDRTRILDQYASGKLRVLTSVNVLTEGFDVPDTQTVILARGFGTSGGYIQAVGRGMRPAPGKDACLVLDLRGCSHEHGEPDDERIYSLEGRGIRRASDALDVRYCPVCGQPTTSSACDACGYTGELRMRKPRVLGLPIDRFARVRADDSDARAARLGKWIRECRTKGWKEGRAMHRYNAAYGEWPTSEISSRARRMA